MSDDTISRQATIDAIEQHKTAVLEGREWDEGIAYGYAAAHRHLVEIVKKLPSAERRGRWIEEYSANHFQAKCSACGESTLYGITYDLEGNAYYMNYCPNCGARMGGGENG